MSDLVKHQSFDDRLRAKLNSQNPGNRSTCLLLDVSGSMEGQPFHKLRQLASSLSKFRRFQFSSTCYEIDPKDDIDFEGDGTAMGTAFWHIKQEGIAHCVIITDGQPDSEQDALKNAVGLKIDILYVGPDPAPPFLERLANATGGKYGEATLEGLKELETKVRALLPSPSGAIQL